MYSWGDERRFNSYSGYFRRIFGARVQKLSVNSGLSCPNRDGTLGKGGCTFCSNEAFTPSYCQPQKGIRRQIEEGIEFHRNRYREAGRYLVYFQSFSNTYAPLSQLAALFEEALSVPHVAGIIVGTRPDCIDSQKLDYFEHLAQRFHVVIEYGIESCDDTTLGAINRGHDFACAQRAVEQTAARGIAVGGHFILGLPGELPDQLLSQVDQINALPLTTVKFHQLQLFKGTPMAEDFRQHPSRYRFFERDEYLDLMVNIVERLRPDLVLERFAGEAPPRFQAGPTWGAIRNEQLWSLFEGKLAERDTFQGKYYRCDSRFLDGSPR